MPLAPSLVVPLANRKSPLPPFSPAFAERRMIDPEDFGEDDPDEIDT